MFFSLSSVKDLSAWLRKEGLNYKGKKVILIERILEHLALKNPPPSQRTHPNLLF
jgi:hypothetical protein